MVCWPLWRRWVSTPDEQHERDDAKRKADREAETIRGLTSDLHGTVEELRRVRQQNNFAVMLERAFAKRRGRGHGGG